MSELRALIEAATVCVTCGSPVRVVSDREGTCYYEPVIPAEELDALIDAAKGSCRLIENSHARHELGEAVAAVERALRGTP